MVAIKVKNGVDEAHQHAPLAGPSSAEVVERRRQHGTNVLPAEKGPSAWSILFSQLKSPLRHV
jgi:magnesium-transporting ATPase (P-type)